LVFKPDACYPNNVDPRFLHMQDPNDPDEKRVMIELRIDANNQVYMDGFMKTDLESLPLIDASLVHATEVWQHAAITYKDSILTTYFNGVKELSGKVAYTSKIINTVGKTSLGGRMDKRKYYSGLMKFLKVSHAVLDPEDFIFIHDQPALGRQTEVFYKFGDMEIFPNPVDMELKLSVGDISSGTTVELSVIDPSGKVLYNHKSESDNDDIIRVNTAEFQEGVYLVSLRSNERIDCGRIVILH